jgi:hypothetical protein
MSAPPFRKKFFSFTDETDEMQGDENRASSLCELDSFRELPTQVQHLLWTVPCPHDASSSLPTVVHTLAKHASGYERGAIGH